MAMVHSYKCVCNLMMTTRIAVCNTDLIDANAAGALLTQSIQSSLAEVSPDVMIVFASPALAFKPLLDALQRKWPHAVLVGCSSAGEFTGTDAAHTSVSVMAIASTTMRFSAAIGTALRHDRRAATAQAAACFTAQDHPDYPYRSALVLTDALAGYAEDLIHALTVATGGTYQLFGGGAADDARFEKTHVFFGTEAYADAVVVLEMLSKKPIGIGVRHGWRIASQPLRVTAAEGNRIISLNAMPAADVFEDQARQTGQYFDRADPMPFFLHNIIGIEAGGEYKLRVPLSLDDEGAITFAAEVSEGAVVHIMTGNTETACDAAREATQAALHGLDGFAHAGALVFDCAATRLRLGKAFEGELTAVADTLGTTNFTGCNTYGQIARVAGQFSGFHNCTAIVCAIPA